MRGKRLLVYNPFRRGKKTPCIQPLQEREKTPCVQSLQEREKTPCVQSQSVFISDQYFQISTQEKSEVVPVGSRLNCFLPKWEKQGANWSILCLIRDGYKLHSAKPQTIQVSLHHQRLRSLQQTKCLVDLY